MKKLLTVLLIAAVGAGILSGCGGAPAADREKAPAPAETVSQEKPAETEKAEAPAEQEEPPEPEAPLNGTVVVTYEIYGKNTKNIALGYYDPSGEDRGMIELDVVNGVVEIPVEIDGLPVASLESSAVSQYNATAVIREIRLPHLVAIDLGAFNDCEYLEAITVAEGHGNYSSRDGVLYGIVQYGDGKEPSLRIYPRGKQDETFTVPGDVREIQSGAFTYNNYIREIVIENGVHPTTIQGGAFEYCRALERVVMPEEVSIKITKGLFRGCKSLKEVVGSDGKVYPVDAEGNIEK